LGARLSSATVTCTLDIRTTDLGQRIIPPGAYCAPDLVRGAIRWHRGRVGNLKDSREEACAHIGGGCIHHHGRHHCTIIVGLCVLRRRSASALYAHPPRRRAVPSASRALEAAIGRAIMRGAMLNAMATSPPAPPMPRVLRIAV
jgi:hypothetical protein